MAATALRAGPGPGATIRHPLPRARAARWLTRDHAAAQLVRFALVGGSANLVYAGVFLVLAGAGGQTANLAGVGASTALANELHRRLTFRAGNRVGWATAQWAGGGLAVLGLAASALTLAALESGTRSPGPVVTVLWVCAVSGAVGLARFAALRWVLGAARPGDARSAPSRPRGSAMLAPRPDRPVGTSRRGEEIPWTSR